MKNLPHLVTASTYLLRNKFFFIYKNKEISSIPINNNYDIPLSSLKCSTINNEILWISR